MGCSLETRLDQLLKEKEKIDKEIAELRSTIGSAGITVFRQIDIDHDGTVSQKELLRVLKVLPRPKDVPAGPKLSIEDLASTLDVNGDGAISEDEVRSVLATRSEQREERTTRRRPANIALPVPSLVTTSNSTTVFNVATTVLVASSQWIAQIHAIPSLKASIEQAIDPATGKIIGYRSLEQQLFKLQKNVADLDAKIAGGEAGLEEELEKRKAQAKKLEDKGIVPESFDLEEGEK